MSWHIVMTIKYTTRKLRFTAKFIRMCRTSDHIVAEPGCAA